MSGVFQNDQTYVLGDSALDVLGSREKLAQWRHKRKGPAYYKLGRKIVYRGTDLNAWLEQNRTDPSNGS